MGSALPHERVRTTGGTAFAMISTCAPAGRHSDRRLALACTSSHEDECEPSISRCAVDADGVFAEWIESVVATPGQPTIVYFRTVGPWPETDSRDDPAARLALATGSRVLSVECASPADGVIAFAWLLAEGLDLDTTTITGQPDDDLPVAVQALAATQSLPLPRRVPRQAKSSAS